MSGDKEREYQERAMEDKVYKYKWLVAKGDKVYEHECENGKIVTTYERNRFDDSLVGKVRAFFARLFNYRGESEWTHVMRGESLVAGKDYIRFPEGSTFGTNK